VLNSQVDGRVLQLGNTYITVVGILKGYDPLMNLVLDSTVEFFDENERNLGLAVCRSTTITAISPEDGAEQIANPFV
jgi:U6 snRNA-associated Sm-like protein LSm7